MTIKSNVGGKEHRLANIEWAYTSRGQVQCKKKIGASTFQTQYGYHPDGSVRPVLSEVEGWMQYPGGNASQAGEKLEFTCLPSHSRIFRRRRRNCSQAGSLFDFLRP
jgi:hypothetical protein